jgi:hypothetical protein
MLQIGLNSKLPMAEVTTTTPEPPKQPGRNPMLSKLQPNNVSPKSPGKNTKPQKDESIGIIRILERVYGVCLKHIKMLSMDRKRMGMHGS